MNWVGGARSRIRLHNDRKKQKEFFERKKYMTKVQQSCGSSPCRKQKGISQDLLSLQTISVAHSQHRNPKNDINNAAKRVNKIDLDHCKSSRNSAFSVELPMSPISIPSSIELHTAGHETNCTHAEMHYNRWKTREHTKGSSSKGQLTANSQSSATPCKEYCSSSVKLKKPLEVYHKQTSFLPYSTPAPKPEFVNFLKTHGRSSSPTVTKEKDNSSVINVDFKRLKRDLFEIEDFQTTPLKKYCGSRTKEHHTKPHAKQGAQNKCSETALAVANENCMSTKCMQTFQKQESRFKQLTESDLGSSSNSDQALLSIMELRTERYIHEQKLFSEKKMSLVNVLDDTTFNKWTNPRKFRQQVQVRNKERKNSILPSKMADKPWSPVKSLECSTKKTSKLDEIADNRVSRGDQLPHDPKFDILDDKLFNRWNTKELRTHTPGYKTSNPISVSPNKNTFIAKNINDPDNVMGACSQSSNGLDFLDDAAFNRYYPKPSLNHMCNKENISPSFKLNVSPNFDTLNDGAYNKCFDTADADKQSMIIKKNRGLDTQKIINSQEDPFLTSWHDRKAAKVKQHDSSYAENEDPLVTIPAVQQSKSDIMVHSTWCEDPLGSQIVEKLNSGLDMEVIQKLAQTPASFKTTDVKHCQMITPDGTVHPSYRFNLNELLPDSISWVTPVCKNTRQSTLLDFSPICNYNSVNKLYNTADQVLVTNPFKNAKNIKTDTNCHQYEATKETSSAVSSMQVTPNYFGQIESLSESGKTVTLKLEENAPEEGKEFTVSTESSITSMQESNNIHTNGQKQLNCKKNMTDTSYGTPCGQNTAQDFGNEDKTIAIYTPSDIQLKDTMTPSRTPSSEEVNRMIHSMLDGMLMECPSSSLKQHKPKGRTQLIEMTELKCNVTEYITAKNNLVNALCIDVGTQVEKTDNLKTVAAYTQTVCTAMVDAATQFNEHYGKPTNSTSVQTDVFSAPSYINSEHNTELACNESNDPSALFSTNCSSMIEVLGHSQLDTANSITSASDDDLC